MALEPNDLSSLSREKRIVDPATCKLTDESLKLIEDDLDAKRLLDTLRYTMERDDSNMDDYFFPEEFAEY